MNVQALASTCTRDNEGGTISDGRMCATPLTYFLRSERAQTLTLTVFLDDNGAIYVNGARVLMAALTNTVEVAIPQGDVALSFLSCSTNGPSFGWVISERFLADQTTLTIDYDRVFHRNGR